MNRLGIIVTFVVIMLGALAYQHQIPEVSVSSTDDIASDNHQPLSPSKIDTQKPRLPTELPVAESLRDIQPDFRLQQDDEGNLIITLDILDLFELYRSALGELTEENIHTLIQHYAAQQLSAPASEQLMALFRRYCAYLKAAADIPVFIWNVTNNIDWQSARQQAADIEALQRHYLPDAYDIFFAHDNRETLRLLNQLQYGEHTPAVTTAIAQQTNPDTERRQRERQQQRERWQQRLDDFSVWQQTLIQSGLAESEYQQLLQQELQQRFAEHEQYRVKSLLALW